MNKSFGALLTAILVMSAGTPASAIVINEILADPAGDPNGDGILSFVQDEFIELANETASALDVSGWTLSDGAELRHVFPVGTTIPAGCGLVVFGGGVPFGPFGRAIVQTASTGSLSLNNTGDTVTVAQGGSPMATVTYGVEGGSDESLARDPDVTGAWSMRHTVIPGAVGPWSPGTLVTGAPFSGCSASVPALPRFGLWLLGLLLSIAGGHGISRRARTAS